MFEKNSSEPRTPESEAREPDAPNSGSFGITGILTVAALKHPHSNRIPERLKRCVFSRSVMQVPVKEVFDVAAGRSPNRMRFRRQATIIPFEHVRKDSSETETQR